MTEYDAVLFDNDGVLIEPPATERQFEATRNAFAEFDVRDVDDGHLEDVAGGVTHDRLHEVCAVHDLEAAALWAARDNHDQRLQRDDIEAGVRTTYDDLLAIGECDVPRGVVSNNHHTIVEFILEHFEIGHLFETYYGRERSVEALRRKKPDPHYLRAACEDLGADTALYVGDRESDVIAAHNAGLDSVFVRREHCRDVTLETTPTHEIETLRELPALLDGRSP